MTTIDIEIVGNAKPDVRIRKSASGIFVDIILSGDSVVSLDAAHAGAVASAFASIAALPMPAAPLPARPTPPSVTLHN